MLPLAATKWISNDDPSYNPPLQSDSFVVVDGYKGGRYLSIYCDIMFLGEVLQGL